MVVALGMIGYLASHVGTGIPKEDNNYLLCLFCLVLVSSHRRIQESHTRNEAREIVREALGPGMGGYRPGSKIVDIEDWRKIEKLESLMLPN